MKPIVAGCLGACFALCYSGVVKAKDQPYISGNVSAPGCVDAINFAKQVYVSTSPYLYAPTEIPHGLNSIIILGTTDVDISGGDAFEGKQWSHFSRPYLGEKYTGAPHTYWGSDISGGARLVITSTSYAWRGDMYATYALAEAITPQQFKSAYSLGVVGQNKYKPIVADSWRPPIVFWSKADREPWFITVGGRYELDGSWKVYILDGNTYKASCVIHFWPSVWPTRPPVGLPKKVSRLKVLLDQLQGHDSIQQVTSMQPITAHEFEWEHVWLNAAYRPWALSDTVAGGSSTAQVNTFLLEWGRKSQANEKLYSQIEHAYPLAERALSSYYRSHFGLSKADAKHNAKWVLDVVFRGAFVLPDRTPYFMRSDAMNPNPWSTSR